MAKNLEYRFAGSYVWPIWEQAKVEDWQVPPVAFGEGSKEDVMALLTDAQATAQFAGLYACEGFWVVLRLRNDARRVSLVSVEVKAFRSDRTPRGRITSSDTLRRLPLAGMEADLRGRWVDHLKRQSSGEWPTGDPEDPEFDSWIEEVKETHLKPYAKAERALIGDLKAAPSPQGYDREHYEKVAQVYSEAVEAGRGPTKAVAGAFKRDGKRIAYSTAAKWVRKCRELGLLPETTTGKAKGSGIGQEG